VALRVRFYSVSKGRYAQVLPSDPASVFFAAAALAVIFTKYDFRSRNNSPDTLATITFLQETFLGIAGPIDTWSEIEIKFPATMRENQTLSVTSIYSARIQQFPMTAKPLDSSAWPLTLYLNSAGFTIAPDKPIKYPIKSKLPLSQVWTISPRSEGEHLLTLKLDEDHAHKIKHHEAFINGAEVAATSEGYIQLPITVNTKWGIPAMYEQLIIWVLALLGAILVWEPLTAFIKKRAGI
jgi:hypothetical protein